MGENGFHFAGQIHSLHLEAEFVSALALLVCNKATLLKPCCFTHPRFHSSCHGKRPLTCSTCGRIYQQEFTNNNNLSYDVFLMISKTPNRFQINLRILDQHFQNFEFGKKDNQFLHRQHNFLSCSPFLRIRLASSKNAFQKRLHIGICFETSLIKTFFSGRHY